MEEIIQQLSLWDYIYPKKIIDKPIRLMGFSNEDYQAMRDIGMSDNAIYHMAGDSIVVTVLMSIFSTLLFDDDRHKQIVKDYIKGGIIEER